MKPTGHKPDENHTFLPQNEVYSAVTRHPFELSKLPERLRFYRPVETNIVSQSLLSDVTKLFEIPEDSFQGKRRKKKLEIFTVDSNVELSNTCEGPSLHISPCVHSSGKEYNNNCRRLEYSSGSTEAQESRANVGVQAFEKSGQSVNISDVYHCDSDQFYSNCNIFDNIGLNKVHIGDSVKTFVRPLDSNKFEIISVIRDESCGNKVIEVRTPISFYLTSQHSNCSSEFCDSFKIVCIPGQPQAVCSPDFDNKNNHSQIICKQSNERTEIYEMIPSDMPGQKEVCMPKYSAIPIAASSASSSLSPNKWVPREALHLSEYEASLLPKWVTVRESVQPPIIMQPCRISTVNNFSCVPLKEAQEPPTVCINPSVQSSCQHCYSNFHQCILPLPGSKLDYYKIPNYWYMTKPYPCPHMNYVGRCDCCL